jgi:hypothetical protein
MTPDQDMALKFAVVALRNALLKRAVLSQAEIDVELGDIFAKIAIDKTLGSTLLESSGLNFAKVEHYARTILGFLVLTGRARVTERSLSRLTFGVS